MLRNEFIEMFACPNCKGNLDYSFEIFICRQCNKEYKFRNSIAEMFIESQVQESSEGERSDQAVSFKEKVKEGYAAVAKSLEASGLSEFATFLNLGYIQDHNRQFSQIALYKYTTNKNSVNLLLEVVGNCSIENDCILEVGCGRGGNIAGLNQYFNPKLLAGIDICQQNIEFCESTHLFDNSFFCIADAENIPFTSDTFDAVLNIESSHSYPNIKKFYEEVYRVLRKGGKFLYTDVMYIDVFEKCEKYLLDMGFNIIRNQDITSNVLLACEDTARKRINAYSNIEINGDLRQLEEFLGTPNSDIYKEMEKGIKKYKILTAIKL